MFLIFLIAFDKSVSSLIIISFETLFLAEMVPIASFSDTDIVRRWLLYRFDCLEAEPGLLPIPTGSFSLIVDRPKP